MNPLRSLSGVVSTPDPIETETKDVSRTVALTAAVFRIGQPRLLLAKMDWEKLYSSANPPGAVAPSVARDTLTRQAIRRKENARRAYRSGIGGLARAIRAA
jgi:hypothetical protein